MVQDPMGKSPPGPSQPTLSEMHSKQPFHMLDMLRVDCTLPNLPSPGTQNCPINVGYHSELHVAITFYQHYHYLSTKVYHIFYGHANYLDYLGKVILSVKFCNLYRVNNYTFDVWIRA